MPKGGMGMPCFVYMLRCNDGSLYTGWTNDLTCRVKAHQDGKGAKYTRAHRPVFLVYVETYHDKQTAMRREYQLKRLSKAQKEALICEYEEK